MTVEFTWSAPGYQTETQRSEVHIAIVDGQAYHFHECGEVAI